VQLEGGEICPLSSLSSMNSTLSALELKLSLLDDLLTSSSGILHQIIPGLAILDELAPIS